MTKREFLIKWNVDEKLFFIDNVEFLHSDTHIIFNWNDDYLSIDYHSKEMKKFIELLNDLKQIKGE
ncbi:hypothetical protein [Spiroplasma endosymbiont of Lasioglossum malachurum]|uniref:hypothetical protein n=1 Tax=Spiroplasma endosymbiont of Lasioglossum malachurum TaxID=3066319 RepID=UPI0030CFEE76